LAGAKPLRKFRSSETSETDKGWGQVAMHFLATHTTSGDNILINLQSIDAIRNKCERLTVTINGIEYDIDDDFDMLLDKLRQRTDVVIITNK
jgi:hypothetical protein